MASIVLALGLFLLHATPARGQEAPAFKLMSYNIHHGTDASNQDRLGEMADFIRQSGVAVVGLQEVDSVCTRSGGIDQAAYLGQITGMHHAFERHFAFQGGAYGQAILSAFPIVDVSATRLPVQSDNPDASVALMVATLAVSEQDTINIVNVHMDYRAQPSRLRQSQLMVQRLKNSPYPLILMGDLNAQPQAPEIAELLEGLQLADTDTPDAFTFPAESPNRKIDYILVDKAFDALRASVPAYTYSDHLPAVAEVRLNPGRQAFRVTPYLLPADQEGGVRLNWFTETPNPGEVWLWETGARDTLKLQSSPGYAHELNYSDLEESERGEFPDMFRGPNWKHTVSLQDLPAGTHYQYQVVQPHGVYRDSLVTPLAPGTRQPLRFVAIADSETDPEGRITHRNWAPGPQHPSSTGRPEGRDTYLLTETQGFIDNLKAIREQEPAFILLAGDIVQGGAYQRAWDEFFRHMAGAYDNILGSVPLLPAIGNWENFGARNGGYYPDAIRRSRAKYKAYFSMPDNQSTHYQDTYYRMDYGPVTVLTLDSSNGLPDDSDNDTNININAADYPGDDLPDINPGSEQWRWVERQLRDARAAGQVIFVQFHHIPYSSGGHILPVSMEGSSGQAGVPMRQYTPLFSQYGVVAVICGHNESLEHSIVDGVHFWDVGIAGDGFGIPGDDKDPRRHNAYSQWIAHRHALEHWEGQQLIGGGKHYGHLLIDVEPLDKGYRVRMEPYHVFPVTDVEGEVVRTELRSFEHVVEVVVP